MPADWRPPRWAAPVTMVLAAAGVGVSAYLTYAHYTTPTTLACPDSGVVNCVKVTTSEQSVIAGVPVALLGLFYFIAMLALSVPAAWRRGSSALIVGRAVAGAAGVAMVVYFVYVELFVLDAICLWCTAAHVAAFLIFAAVVVAMAMAEPSPVQETPVEESPGATPALDDLPGRQPTAP